MKNHWMTAAILCLTTLSTFAQETRPTPGGPRGGGNAPATRPADTTPADKPSVTHGQITVDGKAVSYTATAGYMPLKDETGKLRANIFYVAYVKGSNQESEQAMTQGSATTQSAHPTHEAGRPVTFVFNGGPGAASAWLQLGTAGPYRVEVPEGGASPVPPGKLVENQFSWLGDTDLVFIDPVGTGYSRAATPEQNREFYGVNEDVAAVADFVRLYTTRYERWDSPKFLAGESYGTTRAAALAEHLADRQGLALNGVILISTVLNFENLRAQEGNELPYALFLPTYTATAFYHQKLSSDLQQDLARTLEQAKRFVVDIYTPALMKGANLTESERAGLVDQLARFTGLPKTYVSKSNLRIAPDRFEKELLNDEPNPRIVGRMDTRITAYTADAVNAEPDFDPTISGYLPLYAATFNTYVRQRLHYENELPYELLSGRVGPWNYGGNGASGYLYVGDNLRNAMQRNPHLKVMVASGYYDLATPFFATDYTMAHLNLPAPLRGNLTQTYYPGGHMMYHEKSSLEKLHGDIGKFIRGAAGGSN